MRLAAATTTDASSLPLPHEPVAPDQVVAGSPTTGHAVLDEIAGDASAGDASVGDASVGEAIAGEAASGRTVGVWEMSVGAMRDVEADEIFVVLAGDATVAFEQPALDPIELRPGSVVRLTAGMQTTWTVRETLRKIYIAP
ncbi:DUF861 domain-containing protein [Agromyces sp. CFH 90414]|uniref:DUF861 domain-containing protein n=1 Tax=Agromyces agglutinans TaxID=2662258 RepID=A0A6I2F555_9MICO|nr:DUF861 domain-containing protein [Agromyces agglutinans]